MSVSCFRRWYAPMTTLLVASSIMTAADSAVSKPSGPICRRFTSDNSKPVRQNWTQFLHQIQGQAVPARTVAVEKTDRRIQAARI